MEQLRDLCVVEGIVGMNAYTRAPDQGSMRLTSILTMGALSGPSALYDAWLNSGIVDPQIDAWQVLSAAGLDRVKNSPEEIVNEFIKLPYGAMNARYQLFWGLGKDEVKLNGLREHAVSKVSSTNLPLGKRAAFHARMVVLLAKLHTIADAEKEEFRASLEDDIIFNLRLIADAAIPHEEFGYGRIASLEIVWKNATALLVRDPLTWQFVNMDKLALHAIEFVQFVRTSNYPELLCPMICALQFALSYSAAIRDRRENILHNSIKSHLSKVIEEAKYQKDYWVNALVLECQPRIRFSEQLPQYGELIIGNSKYSDRLRELLFMSRMEWVSQRRSRADEQSPFVSGLDTPVGDTFAILKNYGFNKKDAKNVELFEVSGNPIMGPSRYAQQVAKEYSSLLDEGNTGNSSESFEMQLAPKISTLVPFRDLHERNILYDSGLDDKPADLSCSSLVAFMGGPKLDRDKLLGYWSKLGRIRAHQHMGYGQKKIDPMAIATRVDQLCEEIIFSTATDKLEAEYSHYATAKIYPSNAVFDTGLTANPNSLTDGAVDLTIANRVAKSTIHSGEFAPIATVEANRSNLKEQGILTDYTGDNYIIKRIIAMRDPNRPAGEFNITIPSKKSMEIAMNSAELKEILADPSLTGMFLEAVGVKKASQNQKKSPNRDR